MASNPWLKKNPLMSLWLSGTHSAANRLRTQATAAAKRQSKAAVSAATQQMVQAWLGLLLPTSSARKRARKKR